MANNFPCLWRSRLRLRCQFPEPDDGALFSRILTRLAATTLSLVPGLVAGQVAEVPAPFGEYRVVAARAASDVASTASNQFGQDWMGQSVEFGEGMLTWLDSEKCTILSVREADSPVFFLEDPNLSDVTLGPLDFGSETLDRRLNVPVELICNDLDEQIMAHFVIIDRRVLLVPTPSGETYYVLEIPLNSDQITRLQTRLEDMKFYDGAITGALDEASLLSLGFYAEYRGSAYRFHRTVITENLLDRLGVLGE